MQRILLSLLLTLACGPAWSQEPLTLETLEGVFLTNNPLVQARKAELKVFDGRILDARQRPNPSLNVEVDSVRNGEERETEGSVSLAQEFDWTGRRRWAARSLEHQRQAQSHELTHAFREEITRLKKMFCKVVLHGRDLQALEGVLRAIRTFEGQSRERLREGDIAEVDLLRLETEARRVSRLIDDLRHEADIERKELGVALGLGSAPIALPAELAFPRRAFAQAALLTQAREGRADLAAARERIQGADAAVVAARKEPRAPVSLEGGYKGRSGGFKGFVLGVSVPLPWSHRNQGRIREIEAEREAERLRIEAVERTVAGQVPVALERLAFLATRSEQLTRQLEDLEQILKINTFAYEEGESSLLDVLDAVRSESDLILEMNRTTLEAWSTVFDLEALTGTNLATEAGATRGSTP